MIGGIWLLSHDGDPAAFGIMARHYTYQHYRDGRRANKTNPNRMLFVGPGEKLVMVTADYSALFVWRKFIDASGQQGVNCAVFRNESTMLASDMILAAEIVAWQKWPGQRLYTYVNPRRIKSTNPGYCFQAAGWRKCGMTSKGLIIMEKLAGNV